MRKSKTVLRQLPYTSENLEPLQHVGTQDEECSQGRFEQEGFRRFACSSLKRANTSLHEASKRVSGCNFIDKRTDLTVPTSVRFDEIDTPLSQVPSEFCTPGSFAQSSARLDTSIIKGLDTEKSMFDNDTESPSTPRSTAFFSKADISPDVLRSELHTISSAEFFRELNSQEALQPECSLLGETGLGKHWPSDWRIEHQKPFVFVGSLDEDSIYASEKENHASWDSDIITTPHFSLSNTDTPEKVPFEEAISATSALPQECGDMHRNPSKDPQMLRCKLLRDSCCFDSVNESTVEEDHLGSEGDSHRLGYIHRIDHVDTFARIARDAIDKLDALCEHPSTTFHGSSKDGSKVNSPMLRKTHPFKCYALDQNNV